MGKSSLALSNLRALVIVIVVAFHSALAYLVSAPAMTTAFDVAPYTWQAFPIADGHHWIGFDIFCAWQDVSLMALMFFLSGLFAAGSLRRKGVVRYALSRIGRIGVPFALAVLLLSPLAYFPAYLARTADPTVGGFEAQWFSLPLWPSGPEWFLWQLLAVNLFAAAMYAAWPRVIEVSSRAAAAAAERPLPWMAGLVAVSLVTYAPFAFLFSPWRWSSAGPLAVQLCRPVLYLVYFCVGLGLGAHGIERGLLAADGPLARQWRSLWLFAVASFLAWAGLTSLAMPDWNTAPFLARAGSSLAYPVACAGGSLALIALCLRFLPRIRMPSLDSLSQHAYGIYLVHYVFVVWLQYLLLQSGLFVGAKFVIVFAAAALLSWSASFAFDQAMAHLNFNAVKRATAAVLR